MSTEIYIQGFSPDGETGLRAADVLARFPTQEEPDEYGFYRVAYDEVNTFDVSLTIADGQAIAVTILRPCDHDSLWAALYDLLKDAPYIAYMPGTRAVTCTPGIEANMPNGMADALGVPQLVGSPKEIASVFSA